MTYRILCVLSLFAGGALSCAIDRAESPGTPCIISWELPASAPNADGQSKAIIGLVVQDLAGAPMSGVAVTLLSDESSDVVVQPPRTGKDGRSSGHITATSAGVHQLTARAFDSLGTQLSMAEIAYAFGNANGVADATELLSFEVTADPYLQPTQTIRATPLLLLVQDSKGNPLVGQEVEIAALRPGDVVSPTRGVTDSTGHVPVSVFAGSAGEVIVQAKTNNASTQYVFQMAAGKLDLNQSLWSPRVVRAVANAADAITFDLVVRDSTGLALPSIPVTFTSDVPSDALQPTSSITSASGTASVQLRGTKAGTRRVAAVLQAGQKTATGTLVAGPPHASHAFISLTPADHVADGQTLSRITVGFADVNGNPIAGCPLALHASDSEAAFNPASTSTDALGTAQMDVTVETAGLQRVSASCQGLPVEVEAVWVPGPVSLMMSSLAITPATVQAGTPMELRACLKDAHRNALGGTSVLLESSGTGDHILAPTGTTDASGCYSTSMTGTVSESKTITVEVMRGGSVDATLSAPATIVPGPPDAALSQLQAQPNQTVADGNAPIHLTATWVDSFGNRSANRAVVWGGIGPAEHVSLAQGFTSSQGVSDTYLVSTQAHALSPTATSDGITLTTAVRYVPGPPSTLRSRLHVEPNQLVADGVAAAQITAIVNDAFGNPVSNQTTTITVDTGGNTTLVGGGNTTLSGLFQSAITSTAAGVRQLTATAAGAQFLAPVTFLAGPPDASQTVLSISPASVLADGVQAIHLTAQVRDAFGNPVVGATVTPIASGPNTTFSSPSQFTDGSGAYAAVATSLTVQQENLALTVGSVSTDANVNFVAGPPSATVSTFVASPNGNLSSNGLDSSTLTVTVRDAVGHPLANQNVVVALPNARGVLTGVGGLSAADGTVRLGLTSKEAGLRLPRATFGGYRLNTQVSFLPHTPFCPGKPGLGVRAVGIPGSNLSSVKMFDFNKDGKLDVVAASASLPGIYVAYGAGDGTIPTYQGRTSTGAPKNFCLAQLSTSGYHDVVAASGGNYIIVFKNTAGVVQPPQYFGVSGTVAAVCSADLNGDGLEDIVAVSSQTPAGYSVLLSDGNGNFSSPTFHALTGKPVQCVARDFNGNTYADLAVINATNNTLTVFDGDGTGGFNAGTSYATGSKPQDIVSGLLDGDNLLDIVVSNSGASPGTVSVFKGQSGGGFSPQAAYATDGAPGALDLYDMDLDGKLDILVVAAGADTTPSIYAKNVGQIDILRNSGAGSFSERIAVSTGSIPAGVSAGLFNNDGYPDLATNTSIRGIVLFAQGPASFKAVPTYAAVGGSNTAVKRADFNGDGNVDLVTFGNTSFAQIWQGVGNANFLKPTTLNGAKTKSFIEVADFSGDGHDDIIVPTGTDPNVWVYLGQGNMNFVPVVYTGATAASYGSMTASADVNNDGKPDLVLLVKNAETAKTFSVDASGGMTVLGSYTIPVSSDCRNMRLADVDNDGFADLILACKSLMVMTGDGTGNFSNFRAFGGVAINNDTLENLSVADLNLDGFVDVVTNSDSILYFALSRSDGTYTVTSRSVPGHTGPFVVADINGDGIDDIVMQNYTYGFNVFLGNGDGTVKGRLEYQGGYDLGLPAPGLLAEDFDRDGKLDLAVMQYEGVLSIKLANGCEN